MLPDFQLVRPASLEEAVEAISEERVPVGGGTELLLAMKLGMLMPEALVDLTRLAELGEVEMGDGELVVGAGVSHLRLSTNADVRTHFPMLARVERAVGNPRVRAQGSIGGNLCFAEPKSDVATALIALDAEVTLLGPRGRRRMPVAEFIEGPYTTARADDELLVDVRVPVAGPRRASYVKFQTMERPTVGVASVVDDSAVRVVVGAVGALPVRADFPSVDAVDVDAILAQVEPLPDLTGSEDYKLHVTGVYIRRALEELA